MSLSWRDRLERLLLRNGLMALSATWRFDERIPADCLDAVEGREPTVIAVWHGSMLPAWYRFRHHDAAAMISGSRDGDLLGAYLERIGYRAIIRGSSSRGGSQALAAGVEALGRRSLLITPDGPRGPAREAKPGVLVAAARSGRRMLLVGCRPERAIRVRSWDRLAIPLPFTRVVFRYCILDTSFIENPKNITSEDLRRFGDRLAALERPDDVSALHSIDDTGDSKAGENVG